MYCHSHWRLYWQRHLLHLRYDNVLCRPCVRTILDSGRHHPGLYGIQVAELSIRYPHSGGVFVFPAKAMGKTEKEGKIWGFISAWGYIISNIIAVAFSAIYVATYMGVGFEALANLQTPLAIAAVILVTILNLMKGEEFDQMITEQIASLTPAYNSAALSRYTPRKLKL